MADKFVGPYHVATAGPVAFCFELVLEWKIRDIFHVSKQKSANSFTGGTSSNSYFWPLRDSSNKYEVENLLDVYMQQCSHSSCP